MKTAFKALCTALALFIVHAAPAGAQDYPNRPNRLVIPWPTGGGGGGGVVFRLWSQQLAENLGQQVVVDNRPGHALPSASKWWRSRSPMATRWAAPTFHLA